MTDLDEGQASRKIYWVGRQWCVTDFGLETIDADRYYVESALLGRLTDHDVKGLGPIAETVRHISRKGWVDIEDLFAAFALAVAIHDVRLPVFTVANTIGYVREVRDRDAAYARLRREHLADLKAAGRTPTDLTTEESFQISAVGDAEIDALLDAGRNYLEIAPSKANGEVVDPDLEDGDEE